jgi:membrane protease subunit (stomatin/prohibitin family)
MGMGVGLGFGMGNMMGQQMTGAAQQMGQQGFPAGNASAAPPAAPAKSLKEELTDLKELFDGQLITQAEFDAQRTAIMKKHGMGN